MTDLRKAAEQALERLESHDYWMDEEAIQALRQALTPEVTPEVNEPEGWVKIDEVRQYFNSVGCGTIYKTAGEGRVPLYSAPQREWVGLTDDEIAKYWGDAFAGNTQYVQKFARIIEAKLKEKNT